MSNLVIMKPKNEKFYLDVNMYYSTCAMNAMRDMVTKIYMRRMVLVASADHRAQRDVLLPQAANSTCATLVSPPSPLSPPCESCSIDATGIMQPLSPLSSYGSSSNSSK